MKAVNKKRNKNLVNLLEYFAEPKEPITDREIYRITDKIDNKIRYIKNSLQAVSSKFVENNDLLKREFESVEQLIEILEAQEDRDVIENIFRSGKQNLNKELFTEPKLKPISQKIPVPIDNGACEIIKDFSEKKGFDKFVLDFLKTPYEEDRDGDIVRYVLTNLCDPEQVKKTEEEYGVKELIHLYRSLIYPELMKIKIETLTPDIVKPIWEKFHMQPGYKEMIQNYKKGDKFFNPENLEKARKNIKELSNWQQIFFSIYDKLAGQKDLELSPSVLGVLGGKTEPVRKPAIVESLQLKNLSLKEAMEKEYD